jgi:hypothetical protein
MHKRHVGAFIGALMACLFAAAPGIAGSVPPVEKSVENFPSLVQVTYTVHLVGACRLDWRLDMERTKPQFGAQNTFNLQTGFCRPGEDTLENAMPAIARSLAAMHHDGYDPRKFGVLLTGSLWPIWDERMIDCYIARYGANGRAIQPFEYAQLYQRCDALLELNAVLAPYGVRAVPSSREKAFNLDFRKLSAKNNLGFDQDWIARHRHGRGVVPGGALMNFLSIVPLNRAGPVTNPRAKD